MSIYSSCRLSSHLIFTEKTTKKQKGKAKVTKDDMRIKPLFTFSVELENGGRFEVPKIRTRLDRKIYCPTNLRLYRPHLLLYSWISYLSALLTTKKGLILISNFFPLNQLSYARRGNFFLSLLIYECVLVNWIQNHGLSVTRLLFSQQIGTVRTFGKSFYCEIIIPLTRLRKQVVKILYLLFRHNIVVPFPLKKRKAT